MKKGNAKQMKICAFCANWYDPANKSIKPVNLLSGVFEYDDTIYNKCLLTNLPKKGNSSCTKFTNRIYK
jgi:hypothetical protein